MYRSAYWLGKDLLRTGLIFLAAFITLSFALSLAADDEPQPALPTLELDVNGISLQAEIASTSRQRYMGLSFRRSLDENAGMLFVYTAEKPLTFTMRNTLIPLSIAFLSSDLVINEIHHMNVGPDQFFPSDSAAQYALEVNQGWFEANGIEPGMKVTLPLR